MSPALDPLMVGMAQRIGELTEQTRTQAEEIAALREKLAEFAPLPYDLLTDIGGVDVGVSFHIEDNGDGDCYAEIDRLSIGSHDVTGMLLDHLSARTIEGIQLECEAHARDDGVQSRIAAAEQDRLFREAA